MEGCAEAIINITSHYTEKQQSDRLLDIKKVVEAFDIKYKEEQLPALQSIIKECKLDKKVMESTVELMVEAGLKDWRFGEIVVQVVLFMELNNETFHPKDKFIGLLQQHCKMFLWSPTTEEPPSTTNLGCLSLLAHSAHLIRLTDGSTIEQLVQQTSQALHSIFKTCHFDAIQAASQLLESVVDVMVAQKDLKEVAAMQQTISDNIIHARGSKEVRGLLISALEGLVLAKERRHL